MMSTRDLDGVLEALRQELEEVKNRYGGGLQWGDYMRNVGREDAVKDMIDAVRALKQRAGGDDDDGSDAGVTRRRRRGVSTETDDWEPTPGTPVQFDPFG
jgi:hypothetical protein